MGIILNIFQPCQPCLPLCKAPSTYDEDSDNKEIKPIKIHICGYGERKKKSVRFII